jgi:hypothetical protein
MQRQIKTTPENAIKNAILQFLARNGIYHFRQNVATTKIRGRLVKFGHVGQSDILGMLPGGQFLAIEVKAPDGSATRAQFDYIEYINKNGGCAFIALSVDDVRNHLQSKGYKFA